MSDNKINGEFGELLDDEEIYLEEGHIFQGDAEPTLVLSWLKNLEEANPGKAATLTITSDGAGTLYLDGQPILEITVQGLIV